MPSTAEQVKRRYSSERLQLGQGMDDNVNGDAVTETTDARAENGANTPMDLTNANDNALVSDKSSDPHDADGADWQLCQTLRQRKKQAQERRNLAALQAQQKQMVNSQKMGSRGQKLPPLPKDDYKIVIRPHQGLPLKAITAPALARAIIEACDNQFTDETFILRINRGSNIAILSTKYSEVAELVRKLQQLAINGKPHPVRAYVATGEEALRGVVHGIQPNTSMETLMTHLRIRTQGVELVQARMIGNTKSAALTFYGDKLPRTVYFYGGELICHPFRATLQVCKVCREKGHRADVCPQPDKPICRLCGTRNPTTGHPCQLICASCGEAHLTGDPACSKRLKPVQLRNRSSERSEKQLPSQASEVPPRWFSSEEEEEALKLGGQPARTPSKSRSRSKQRPQATKTTNQEAQQPSQATPLKKHNKQQQQGMKTPDLECFEITKLELGHQPLAVFFTSSSPLARNAVEASQEMACPVIGEAAFKPTPS
ncbi:hypothetical protein HPB52_016510 [Rhipicephalus sanguineus]|uniref:Gag-like protein n=1 Tax=Rhipicephalus sanguineus TaxID=34632 RepID=A0A9D4PZI4_RHISA|nr:hypothetical protein HPB52_016510 [Rhipicephalus sanguineus]